MRRLSPGNFRILHCSGLHSGKKSEGYKVILLVFVRCNPLKNSNIRHLKSGMQLEFNFRCLPSSVLYSWTGSYRRWFATECRTYSRLPIRTLAFKRLQPSSSCRNAVRISFAIFTGNDTKYQAPCTGILPGCSFEGVGDGVFVEQYYYL